MSEKDDTASLSCGDHPRIKATIRFGQELITWIRQSWSVGENKKIRLYGYRVRDYVLTWGYMRNLMLLVHGFIIMKILMQNMFSKRAISGGNI
jgi:hypothetical protein